MGRGLLRRVLGILAWDMDTITVHQAPPIAEDSWLQEERFEEFRHAYDYASGKMHAIVGLSKITPEDAYYIWKIIERGRVWHREQHREG